MKVVFSSKNELLNSLENLISALEEDKKQLEAKWIDNINRQLDHTVFDSVRRFIHRQDVHFGYGHPPTKPNPDYAPWMRLFNPSKIDPNIIDVDSVIKENRRTLRAEWSTLKDAITKPWNYLNYYHIRGSDSFINVGRIFRTGQSSKMIGVFEMVRKLQHLLGKVIAVDDWQAEFHLDDNELKILADATQMVESAQKRRTQDER